ncbi:MAG TPA: hydroxymethylbilane synthase [Microbacteriaceae bacterium]|nr:hydroxymethylbilane synthase [Microbacteriaceae bacterium]
MTVLRVGTRGSALALAQTDLVAVALAAAMHVEVEIVPVTTHGDVSRQSLASMGGVGVFASALREALLAGDCDVVVHSLKDLPTEPVPGLAIGAIPKRADARDVLVARDRLRLETLPPRARVGTGSPRRVAQLRAVRNDLDVVDIRGNVDSRLARLSAEDDTRLDAVVLSAAGLTRLGRAEVIDVPLELSAWPTAPGQAALALEVREQDVSGTALAAGLRAVNHATSRASAMAERGVLAGLGAGCSAPVGATAQLADGLFFLTATVYSLDGRASVTASHAATPDDRSAAALERAGREIAERVVAELLAEGAADIAPVGSQRGTE